MLRTQNKNIYFFLFILKKNISNIVSMSIIYLIQHSKIDTRVEQSHLVQIGLALIQNQIHS